MLKSIINKNIMQNTPPKITWFVSKEEQERINIDYMNRIFDEFLKRMGVDPQNYR